MSAMPLDFVTGAVEESLKQQGATLLSNSQAATKNSNGVLIGTFEYKKSTPTATGATVQARSKVVLFQANGNLVMIQLATPQQFGDELAPVLDQVADSITLLDQ
jgi:hypothetical protein